MNRVVNWDIKLHQWQKSILGDEFVWGETDCSKLARKAIEIMYGEDLYKGPDWTTRIGAMRALKKIDSAESELRKMGAKVVPNKNFAQQGDILITYGIHGKFPSVAVIVDDAAVISDSENGVYRVPLSNIDDDTITIMRLPN